MIELSNFPEIIKTERLELRRIEPSQKNAQMIFDVIDASRESLEQWQGFIEYIKNPDDMLKQLQKRDEQWNNKTGFCFGIFKNDRFIGRIRFFNINPWDVASCEIGYWLSDSETGHGFMTEALKALEKQIFELGFNRIQMEIDSDNIKSENIAKKNNYVLEGITRQSSYAKCCGVCDTLIYSKLKSEYK
ncbi:MAG TPA: GNAT family protein [Alphaproteobacteria bacterium]|nr:GNAT family protein [Alphaproteobacteria bacterium]